MSKIKELFQDDKTSVQSTELPIKAFSAGEYPKKGLDAIAKSTPALGIGAGCFQIAREFIFAKSWKARLFLLFCFIMLLTCYFFFQLYLPSLLQKKLAPKPKPHSFIQLVRAVNEPESRLSEEDFERAGEIFNYKTNILLKKERWGEAADKINALHLDAPDNVALKFFLGFTQLKAAQAMEWEDGDGHSENEPAKKKSEKSELYEAARKHCLEAGDYSGALICAGDAYYAEAGLKKAAKEISEKYDQANSAYEKASRNKKLNQSDILYENWGTALLWQGWWASTLEEQRTLFRKAEDKLLQAKKMTPSRHQSSVTLLQLCFARMLFCTSMDEFAEQVTKAGALLAELQKSEYDAESPLAEFKSELGDDEQVRQFLNYAEKAVLVMNERDPFVRNQQLMEVITNCIIFVEKSGERARGLVPLLWDLAGYIECSPELTAIYTKKKLDKEWKLLADEKDIEARSNGLGTSVRDYKELFEHGGLTALEKRRFFKEALHRFSSYASGDTESTALACLMALHTAWADHGEVMPSASLRSRLHSFMLAQRLKPHWKPKEHEVVDISVEEYWNSYASLFPFVVSETEFSSLTRFLDGERLNVALIQLEAQELDDFFNPWSMASLSRDAIAQLEARFANHGFDEDEVKKTLRQVLERALSRTKTPGLVPVLEVALIHGGLAVVASNKDERDRYLEECLKNIRVELEEAQYPPLIISDLIKIIDFYAEASLYLFLEEDPLFPQVATAFLKKPRARSVHSRLPSFYATCSARSCMPSIIFACLGNNSHQPVTRFFLKQARLARPGVET